MDTKSREIVVLERRDIEELLSLADCIDAVERAFCAHAEGRALPTALAHVDTAGGEFHIKAGGVDRYFALKANGGFFGNRAKSGLPNIQGVIYLADASNGTPLAVMDSIAITRLRTGAATAVAAKHLARTDAQSVMICGSGTQARVQLASLVLVRDVNRAKVWSRNLDKAEAFASEMSEVLGIEVELARSLDAAAGCDVVVTCTPSKVAFLRAAWVRPGTFVAAVGADSSGKQELEPELLARATVVTDVTSQCLEVGELHHARDAVVYAELGEIVAGRKAGRRSREEITVFDSTGTALQDAAAAALVYERAVSAGRGTRVPLS